MILSLLLPLAIADTAARISRVEIARTTGASSSAALSVHGDSVAVETQRSC